MKTFEVYGLYDAGHRGRTLVAVVQADFFETQDDYIQFFKSGWSRRQVAEIRVGHEFAVLEAAFSGSITKNVPATPSLAPVGSWAALNLKPDIATPEEEAAWRLGCSDTGTSDAAAQATEEEQYSRSELRVRPRQRDQENEAGDKD